MSCCVGSMHSIMSWLKRTWRWSWMGSTDLAMTLKSFWFYWEETLQGIAFSVCLSVTCLLLKNLVLYHFNCTAIYPKVIYSFCACMFKTCAYLPWWIVIFFFTTCTLIKRVNFEYCTDTVQDIILVCSKLVSTRVNCEHFRKMCLKGWILNISLLV